MAALYDPATGSIRDRAGTSFAGTDKAAELWVIPATVYRDRWACSNGRAKRRCRSGPHKPPRCSRSPGGCRRWRWSIESARPDRPWCPSRASPFRCALHLGSRSCRRFHPSEGQRLRAPPFTRGRGGPAGCRQVRSGCAAALRADRGFPVSPDSDPTDDRSGDDACMAGRRNCADCRRGVDRWIPIHTCIRRSPPGWPNSPLAAPRQLLIPYRCGGAAEAVSFSQAPGKATAAAARRSRATPPFTRDPLRRHIGPDGGASPASRQVRCGLRLPRAYEAPGWGCCRLIA